LRAFSCDQFVLPLPEGHRFPMQKYGRLKEAVLKLPGIDLTEPAAATFEQLVLAHSAEYVSRVFAGSLSSAEVREIGFPWSEAMVERAIRSVGATLCAARTALAEGVAVNLAGGTHHALSSRGSGFCVFNDVAVAIRVLKQERLIQTALVIDLDVHQGNGTAQIFKEDASVFTLSVHGERNFPFRKEQSDIDVGLPDGTEDEAYLNALGKALDLAAAHADSDLLFFLAGADPHHNDRLGRLKLTEAGLKSRDKAVYDFAARHGLPVVVTMAGGYGRDLDQTVAVHYNSIKVALRCQDKIYRSMSQRRSVVHGPLA
jgi:acetoin utilization deacetylase AcuC-like enzyme